MTTPPKSLASGALLCMLAVSSAAMAQGRGRAARAIPDFLASQRCALCHSLSPRATALRTATGGDASPYGLWAPTMMANAFRDPYWRAQVAREVDAHPGAAHEIQALCLTCHAPMAHHRARQAEDVANDIALIERDALGRDGVSCTVCHQARSTGFGEEASFNGALDIRREGRIFGPYPHPAPRPMRMHTGFTPEFGPHIQDSGLCASCHTLRTTPHASTLGHAGAAPFPEQTPYLEWRNSVYSDHDGVTLESRSCQSCHMANLGSMRIARNPGGRDFNIAVRDDVRGHQMVGGNGFMLDLLAVHADELGTTAPSVALARAAAATRAGLYTGTATVEVSDISRSASTLGFDITVTNLTGHKFPTGYPARRAWLEVIVTSGRETVFVSGVLDAHGELIGVVEPLALSHVDVVTRPDEVPVYELVPHDRDGRPTTLLTAMAVRGKDNRLLPAGWRPDGPFAEDTAPKGIGSDPDFVAGQDVVHYRIPLSAMNAPPVRITAWLRYQSIPPGWVRAMRRVRAPEITRFLRMYDGMDAAPETVAVAVAREGA